METALTTESDHNNNNDQNIFDTEDLNRLELTQSIRKKLLTKLVNLKEDGEVSVPATKGEQELLLGILNGSDAAVFSKAKLKGDTQNTKILAQNSLLITDMLMRKDNRNVNANTVKRNIELQSSISDADIVKDETFIGTQCLKVSDFLTKEEME